MSEYRFLMSVDGDDEECQSCGRIAPLCEVRNGMPRVTANLCELCNCTLIGNAYFYPRQYSHVTPRMLAEAIGYLEKKISEMLSKDNEI